MPQATKEYYVRVNLQFTMRWLDRRLTDPEYNPCVGVFEEMLSISEAEAEDSDAVRRWDAEPRSGSR